MLPVMAELYNAHSVIYFRHNITGSSNINMVILENNRLEFRDFGVFESKVRAARIAQNPKTLERVEVSPKRTVKFKMGRLMRENLSARAEQSAKAK